MAVFLCEFKWSFVKFTWIFKTSTFIFFHIAAIEHIFSNGFWRVCIFYIRFRHPIHHITGLNFNEIVWGGWKVLGFVLWCAIREFIFKRRWRILLKANVFGNRDQRNLLHVMNEPLIVFISERRILASN